MSSDKKVTKTEKLENILFTLQLVCVVVNVFSAIWQIHSITSAIIAISFLITAALAFITIANKNDKNTVVLWVFIAVMSYMSVSYTGSDISFSYLKSWIMFMTTINLYFWVYAVEVKDTMIKKVFLCGVLTAILFIVGFLAGRSKANSEMPNLVTFGLTNPNLAGIYLLNVFLCMFILTKFLHSKFLKFICFAICVALVYFIWLTGARSCIIATVACLALSFGNNKKYSKFINFMMLIFPLIFVFIYLKVIDTDFMELFGFMVSEGKTLTSRVDIWQRALYIIENNIFFGNYIHGAGNRHNTHLMILAAFGVVVFAFVMIYLNRIVNYVGSFIREKYQFIALYAFYSIILMGTFEAALFSGSQGMYVFSGAFLLIAKYINEDKDDQQ